MLSSRFPFPEKRMQTEALWQGWFLGAGSVLCVLLVQDQCLCPTSSRNGLSLTSVPVVLSTYFLWRTVAILCCPEMLGFSCEVFWFLMFLWAPQLEPWNHRVRWRKRGCCDSPHNCSLLELANLFLNLLYPPADKAATEKQHWLHTERPGSGLLLAQLLFSRLVYYYYYYPQAPVLAGLPQRESAAALAVCTLLKRQMLCVCFGTNGRADLK